jgi:hypothetical protein
MMRLTELEPSWRSLIDGRSHREAASLAEADGILFRCPKCYAEKGGLKGVHSVICWRPRVTAEVSPGPGRWEFTGTGFDDLTLVARSSSVLLRGGCAAHFFIRAGKIQLT